MSPEHEGGGVSESVLECGRCGAPFREADIDARERVATCRFCGAVTPLPPEPEPPVPAARRDATPLPAARGKVPRPDSIGLDQTSEGLRLTYRWFSPVFFFLLFFCIAWDSFLVFWYWMGLQGMAQAGPMAIIMLVFPIAHVAVGIGLTYFTIAGFLNRTWIDVTRDSLSVRHGPVPWKGNKVLPVDNLDQLYCSVNAGDSSRNSQMQYCINALLKDGRKEKLSALQSADEARFIERSVEEFLGLQHHPVAGELPA